LLNVRILDPNILDRVLLRLVALANEELESRIGRSGPCYEIELLSEADQWELVLLQARKQLAKFGVNPATFDYVLTANPAIVCLVELVKLFDELEDWSQGRSKGAFLYFIEQEFPKLERTVTAWLERRAESKKRSARSGKGATAKAARQREIIADAIRQFDPGEASGKSKRSRAEIIHKRAQSAKARGEFPEADRLPKKLRTYL
jgi:hypothetical protein